MICAIYERRPRTVRNITDPRAAKPAGTIEFEKGRHHENVKAITAKLAELGYKLATTPSKSTHPEFDFVVYVEPSSPASPRAAHKEIERKKPVTVGGSGGVPRRLPLPKSRRGRKR